MNALAPATKEHRRDRTHRMGLITNSDLKPTCRIESWEPRGEVENGERAQVREVGWSLISLRRDGEVVGRKKRAPHVFVVCAALATTNLRLVVDNLAMVGGVCCSCDLEQKTCL